MLLHTRKSTILLLALITLAVAMMSPLHPLSRALPATDSSVFILVGRSMHAGMLPYRDIFDHKGLLLYVINYIGLFFGTIGVWVLELLFLLAATTLCYQCARRFFDESISILAILGSFIAITPWYVGGNLPEVYALPFMFGALYCLLEYFANDYKLRRVSVFIAGACMGGVILLKANMIGVWIGFCATIFVHALLRKRYRDALNYALFFLLGIVSFLAPFIVWLAFNGLLEYFVEAYIIFNMMYSEVSLLGRIDVVIRAFGFTAIFLTSIILALMFFRYTKEKDIEKAVLSCGLAGSFVATLLIATMGGRFAPQYFLMFIPCLVLPFAYLIECMKKEFKIRSGLILLLLLVFFHGQIMEGVGHVRNTRNRNRVVEEVATVIDENTNTNDTMIVLGNICSIYNRTGLFPATRFPYQTTIININPLIRDQIKQDIYDRQPRILVRPVWQEWSSCEVELIQDYEVIFENCTFYVYLRRGKER